MRQVLAVLLLFSSVALSSGFAPPNAFQQGRRHVVPTTKPTTIVSMSSDNDLFGSFTKGLGDMASGIFAASDAPQESKQQEEEEDLPDVVIDPDYRLAGIFVVLALVLDKIPYIQILLGIPVTLLAVLFLVQTFRLRFVFDQEAFELKQGEELDDTAENFVVGGANRWAYDSFVNYDFFPEGWIDQPQGPILVYFKENQTPSENWNDGPGAKANSPEALAAGAKPGQVHFFPSLCNAQQLRAEFEKRNCAKL